MGCKYNVRNYITQLLELAWYDCQRLREFPEFNNFPSNFLICSRSSLYWPISGKARTPIPEECGALAGDFGGF